MPPLDAPPISPSATANVVVLRGPGHLDQRLRCCLEARPEVGIDSRLGRMLGRLRVAIAHAKPGADIPPAFKDALIALVPRLRRYALLLAGEPSGADDLVQTTLLKAWEHRLRFTPGTNLPAWLFTILRNSFYQDRRRRRREVPDPDGAHAATLHVEASQEQSLDLHDLRIALEHLDPALREALLLITIEGLPYETAAGIVGCPLGTLKSRVSRARSQLAERLAG